MKLNYVNSEDNWHWMRCKPIIQAVFSRSNKPFSFQIWQHMMIVFHSWFFEALTSVPQVSLFFPANVCIISKKTPITSILNKNKKIYPWKADLQDTLILSSASLLACFSANSATQSGVDATVKKQTNKQNNNAVKINVIIKNKFCPPFYHACTIHQRPVLLCVYLVRVVKISRQPVRFTSFFEYSTGYSEC